MLLSEEQPENADTPILVTLSGMVIDVKPLQPENAEEPMLVTLPSSGIMLFLQPKIKVFIAGSIKQLSMLRYFVFPIATIIDVKPLQPENAEEPILVTLSGIVIDVKPLQP